MLRYLDSTADYCITYGGAGAEAKLSGYVDANYAGDKHTSKSTTGYVFMFNGGLVSWCSKRQATITLSSTEAEYIALCQAAREAAWLRQLMVELGIYEGQPITINKDNQGAIALGKNPQWH